MRTNLTSLYTMQSILVLLLVHAVKAATVTYNWRVTWVEAAPDGFTRPVIGIEKSCDLTPFHHQTDLGIKVSMVSGHVRPSRPILATQSWSIFGIFLEMKQLVFISMASPKREQIRWMAQLESINVQYLLVESLHIASR